MGEMAFVLGQGAQRSALGLVLPIVLIAVLVLVWLLARRIRRWFGRSLKAQEDLARSVADVSDRLERIEAKLQMSGHDES